MNWFEQGNWSNFLSEAQKNMTAPWTGAGAPFNPGAAFPGGMFAGGMFPGAMFPGSAAGGGPASGEAAQGGIDKVNELVKQTLEGWATLMQGAGRGKNAFDPEMLAKLFDPTQWSKLMSGGADLSLERLTEGPTYATVTDIDRKILKAQQLWLQRARDIEGYRQVVQAAWLRAFDKLRQALADPKGAPLASSRAVLDLWLAIANEALLEMHHRPEFQEAQRRMTRSAAEYRLQEQELAEVFCALNHIPTRTEMDEAQKTIHELRRELRAIKRRLDENEVKSIRAVPQGQRQARRKPR